MTPRQREALDFIVAYQLRWRGVSPTYAEIAVGIGLSEARRGNISALLGHLERLGMINRPPGAVRDIFVANPGNHLARIPRHVLQSELERRDRDTVWRRVVCDRCGARTEAPGVRACTEVDCPIKIKEAA